MTVGKSVLPDLFGTGPMHECTIIEAVSAESPLALRIAAGMTGRIAADLGARVVRLVPDNVVPKSKNSARDRFLEHGKETHFYRCGCLNEELADLADVDAVIAGRDCTIGMGDAIRVELALHASDTHYPATEFTVTAEGGLLNMIGEPEKSPLKLGGNQAAYALGLSAFLGLSAALLGKNSQTAQVQPSEIVRANLLDTIVWLNWKAVPFVGSVAPLLVRAGDEAEWQVLKCADGWVAIVYQEGDWARICEMFDDARLRDKSLAIRTDRLRQTRKLATIFEDVMAHWTRHEIREKAIHFRLPIGPVWSPAELLTDQHNLERDFFRAASQEIFPRLPVIWNGQRSAGDSRSMPDAESRAL